jgi:hypothetical protein
MAKTEARMTKKETPAKRGNARPVTSVENFAHRKGADKALSKYRERKEKKRVHTATALRSYKKVMKREGYEAGMGASRKRAAKEETDDEKKHDEKTDDEKNHDERTDDEKQHDDQKISSDQETRRKRTSRFQNSVQKAEVNKQEIQKSQEDRVMNERQKQKKLKERHQRTMLLCKRTRRGQPVMKNLVEDILQKLERQKEP